MEKKLAAIAVIGIIIITGITLSSRYGLTVKVNWRSAEAVSEAYVNFLIKAKRASFWNRQDRAAYELLSLEAREVLAGKTGPLLSRLLDFNGQTPAPDSFEITGLVEEGDRARVNFIWRYQAGSPEIKKTIFLIQRDDHWQIHSIVNTDISNELLPL